MSKHFLKSKTNWVQAPLIVVLVSALEYPEVQKIICEDGHFVLAGQVILTLVARNMFGGLRFKKDRGGLK